MEVCPTSAAKHSWVFDGDDPYVTCHFCNEMRDAISGVVVRAGVILPPLIESGGAPTRKAGASGNAEANETTPGVSAHVGMSRAATASMPEWRQVAEDMAMLVQILWARYPAFMPPAELVDFMDSLPDDFLHALMAATGYSHKAAAWDNDHLTCVLIRSLDDSEEQK